MSQNSWMNLLEKPSAPGALFVLACLIDWSSSSIVKFRSRFAFSTLFNLALRTVSLSATSSKNSVIQSGLKIFSSGFLYRSANVLRIYSSLSSDSANVLPFSSVISPNEASFALFFIRPRKYGVIFSLFRNSNLSKFLSSSLRVLPRNSVSSLSFLFIMFWLFIGSCLSTKSSAFRFFSVSVFSLYI